MTKTTEELLQEAKERIEDMLKCDDGQAFKEARKFLERISPTSEPDVDEATVWTRKVMNGWTTVGGLRTVIAELIASKDGEIERLAGINSQLVAEHNAMNQDGARLESELATLQAENERLKRLFSAAERAIGDHHAPHDCYATGPLTGDGYRDLIECPACAFFALRDELKAAERNTAEPEHRLSDESNRKAGEVVRSTDSCSSDGSGNLTPVVEVTQADRNAAAEIWNSYVAKIGEVIAEKAIREGLSDDTMIVQAFSRIRTEAEARGYTKGRREALDAISEDTKQWVTRERENARKLFKPSAEAGNGHLHFAAHAAFKALDELNRMMTGGK